MSARIAVDALSAVSPGRFVELCKQLLEGPLDGAGLARQETTRGPDGPARDDCADGLMIKAQRYGSPPTWVEPAAASAEAAR